ncbi:MAG: hypothetical protein KDC44_02525 [Phaeodactylibacter sp.]|nr:hypothetical protein [Phaeodactylibacter sp.]
MKNSSTLLCLLIFSAALNAQAIIPFDTTYWEIKAQGHVRESFEGKDAIYLKQGFATLKDVEFYNGTIEFDIYLTERRSFPGIRFRITDDSNMESFYFRPHQSGNPDANQATPVINGHSGWQLYFGPAYSFAYEYAFDTWTHVKLVVKDQQAQLFLNHTEQPNLSWHLKQKPEKGAIAIGGSGPAAMHYANFKYSTQEPQLVNFQVPTREPIEGVIQEWTISDKFEETELEQLDNLDKLIQERTWPQKIQVEENYAANISRAASRNGSAGNTVFAKITLQSDQKQWKLLEFGYSDRVVVLLNGKPIYRGANGFVTRDYRYLGTIGFFDAVYLDLKKGENTLLFAVSEDFGGWGVMARLVDERGVTLH